ncbi:hypothetical protein F5H01DRAFT_330987 [Linnemannia elongata]|nr:hypothetical protein F5H01DRAFT_330987 [Linnemannia elongata]
MSTATQCFFNTQELVEWLTDHLDKPDSSRLSRTSRQLHLWVEPLLFRDLDLTTPPQLGVEVSKMFFTPTARNSLIKNAHRIRKLKASLREFVFIQHCLLKYLDSVSSTIDDDPGVLSRPSWLPPLDDPTDFPVILLEPMVKLNDLDLNLHSNSPENAMSPFLPQGTQDFDAILARLRWTLQMSPRLVKVTLKVPVIDQPDFQFFGEVIAGLQNLEELDVEVAFQAYAVSPEFRLWSSIFFACRPSIRRFLVRLYILDRPSNENYYDHEDDDHYNNQEVTSFYEPERSEETAGDWRRQDPLIHLTELVLPKMKKSSTPPTDLQQVLAHCPNLTCLGLRLAHPKSYQRSLVTIITDSCPKLRTLSFEGDESSTLTFPLICMQGLSENQLEEFRVSRYFFNSKCTELVNTMVPFQRHFASLRVLEFSKCKGAEDGRIGSVLRVCGGLEVLKLKFHPQCQSYMRLEDAVNAIPWKCIGLKQLEMVISDTAVGRPRPPVASMFTRQLYFTNVTLSTFDASPHNAAIKSKLQRLKQLYQQLGSLVELTHLDLRTVLPDSTRGFLDPAPRTYRLHGFPAMLNLDDTNNGTIKGYTGYLHLLGGLTKLKELRGSVSATTKETKYQMTWSEVRWMADHWPNLEVAEFFEADEEPREEFLWLQKQSKGAKLVLSAPPV